MTALRRRRFRSSLEYTLLAAPALIYLLLFHYLPMGGVVMAFKNYKFNRGIFRSPWVGFRNFDYLFTSHDFTLLMRNTIGYSVAFVVTTTVFGVLTALLLNEISSRSAVKYYQTTMFLPRFLSWVIVGFFTWLLLNPVIGVFNKLLAAAGLEPVSWYTERRYWPFILISVNLWKWVGVNMLFYYAALTGIDRGLYEAADMDGAGRMRKRAMRRTLLLREHGTDARFLTVLEPFRNSPAIRHVHASGPDLVEVSLADGRVHTIELTGLDTGTDLRVSLREHRNGALVREETTS